MAALKRPTRGSGVRGLRNTAVATIVNESAVPASHASAAAAPEAPLGAPGSGAVLRLILLHSRAYGHAPSAAQMIGVWPC